MREAYFLRSLWIVLNDLVLFDTEKKMLSFILYTLTWFILYANLNIISGSGSHCKKVAGSCKHNTSIGSINVDIPTGCYCDVACNIFNDCCHDVSNETKILFEKLKNIYQKEDSKTNAHGSKSHNQSSVAQDIPISVMDTCLRIDDSDSGLWILNKCLKSGRKCSESMSLSDVIRHLPVTDNQNVTYFGAECALCNGVTNYTTWGILARKTLYDLSSDIDIPMLFESIEQGSLQSTLEKVGKIEIISPPKLSKRVCHNFSTKTKLKTTEGCPHYQCTTTLYGFEPIETFRNPECCVTSGRCRKHLLFGSTDIEHVVSSNVITLNIKIPTHDFILFTMPGIKQHPCSAVTKKKPCRNNCTYNPLCPPLKFEVLNYLLRKGHILTFTMDGDYDALITTMVYQMAFTYFWRSNWTLQLGNYIPIYHRKIGQCLGGDMVCTKVQLQLNLMSTARLIKHQIPLLESWTDEMSFSFQINKPLYSKNVSGILSHNTTKISKCLVCDGGNFAQEGVLSKYWLDLLPTEWKTDRNDCTNHHLVLKTSQQWGRDVDTLEVYCKQDIVGDATFNSTDILCFVALLVLHVVNAIDEMF